MRASFSMAPRVFCLGEVLTGFAGIDGDELYIRIVLHGLGQILELRDAVGAPGGPEINDHRLSFKAAQGSPACRPSWAAREIPGPGIADDAAGQLRLLIRQLPHWDRAKAILMRDADTSGEGAPQTLPGQLMPARKTTPGEADTVGAESEGERPKPRCFGRRIL